MDKIRNRLSKSRLKRKNGSTIAILKTFVRYLFSIVFSPQQQSKEDL